MKQYTLVLIAFVLLAVSCKKDLLDVKETDFIGGDIALQTVGNNQQAIIGAYAGLGTEMDVLLNATFADEVKPSEFYNAATTHEWQYTSTDIGIRDNFTAFNVFYRVVDRVNRVLRALPKADSLKAEDSTAVRKRVRGEALFLRSFCHFELYRYYCGNYSSDGLALAYMDSSSLDPKPRIKMGEYFKQMNADLAEAKTLLPNNLTDITRATKLAASALQARIALYMSDWPNAITYSTEYISAIPLANRAQFPTIWTDAGNNELAFKLKRSSSLSGPISTGATSRMGSLFRGTSANATATGIGTVSWQPSDKLWNSYDQVNDIRFNSYLKNEPLLASRKPRLVQKYAGTGYATAAENVADAKVFRTSEMYLIRAEAKAETGDLAGAATDVNTLRAARITGYTDVSFASKADAITAILSERFKELAFEGHRFWDLKRRNLPVERLASDAPTPAGTTLPAGNFRFLLPIPNTEIQANKLMVQNPGYSN